LVHTPPTQPKNHGLSRAWASSHKGGHHTSADHLRPGSGRQHQVVKTRLIHHD
jgi:hypothetical protein